MKLQLNSVEENRLLIKWYWFNPSGRNKVMFIKSITPEALICKENFKYNLYYFEDRGGLHKQDR